MKKVNGNELSKILEDHKIWLESIGHKGIRANLSGANLRWADLRGADLSGADISGADLSKADLSKAELRGADLSGAYLRGANLSGADIRWADIIRAELRYADLSGADLSKADLSKADLRGADLSGADISGAELRWADLRGADLSEAKINWPIACPETGSFTAYKKCNNYIVELRIPKDALRCSATSRKCRCSKAKVVSITHLDGSPSEQISVSSGYDFNFIYTVGKTVKVKDFDMNRWNECSPGIHFFITRPEAVDYGC